MRELMGSVFEVGDTDVTVVSVGPYKAPGEDHGAMHGFVIVTGDDGHDYAVVDDGHVYVCGSDCTRSVAKLPDLWK